jgi:YHS domain-containing protein
MRNLFKTGLIATTLAFGALTTLTTPAFAVDEVLVSADSTTSNLAVSGYDVIAYRTGTPTEGSAAFTTTFEGATYRFANQANLETFQSDPARFAPAYGGFCAFGVSKGKKFDVDPTAFSVIDDVLYLNYNKSIQKKWSKKTDKYISKADTNWTDIRSTAVGDL